MYMLRYVDVFGIFLKFRENKSHKHFLFVSLRMLGYSAILDIPSRPLAPDIALFPIRLFIGEGDVAKLLLIAEHV